MNPHLTTEALTEALHSVAWLRDQLRDANKNCTPVESLLLLPMIAKATEIERDIQALVNARQATT